MHKVKTKQRKRRKPLYPLNEENMSTYKVENHLPDTLCTFLMGQTKFLIGEDTS